MMLIRRRLAPLVLSAAIGLALTGCTSGSDDPVPSDGVETTASATDADGPDGSADTSADEATQVQVETLTAPCPYLDQEIVEGTVGQQISTVLVTTSTPAPGPLPRCEFQRSSGEPAAIIDTVTVEPGNGLAKSLELVPGGNPVNVAEGGSVVVHQGENRTDLAAFSGTTLVSVTINQESSLEATELAEKVLVAAG